VQVARERCLLSAETIGREGEPSARARSVAGAGASSTCSDSSLGGPPATAGIGTFRDRSRRLPRLRRAQSLHRSRWVERRTV